MLTATSSTILMPADSSFVNRPTSTVTRIVGDAAPRSFTGQRLRGLCAHQNIEICSCLRTNASRGIPTSSNTDDLASGSKEISIGRFHAIAIGELHFQSGVVMPTAMSTASAQSPNSANSPHETSPNLISIVRMSTTSPSAARPMAAPERCAASLQSLTRGSTLDQCLQHNAITHSRMPIHSMAHSLLTSFVKPSTKPVVGSIRFLQ